MPVVVYWNDAVVMGPVLAGFSPAAKSLEATARGLAPKATGRLAMGTRVLVTSETTATLGAPGVPYAGFVEHGTRAHTETATNALAMPIGGGRFASSVEHPATRAQPYLQEAAKTFPETYISETRKLFTLGF